MAFTTGTDFTLTSGYTTGTDFTLDVIVTCSGVSRAIARSVSGLTSIANTVNIATSRAVERSAIASMLMATSVPGSLFNRSIARNTGVTGDSATTATISGSRSTQRSFVVDVLIGTFVYVSSVSRAVHRSFVVDVVMGFAVSISGMSRLLERSIGSQFESTIESTVSKSRINHRSLGDQVALAVSATIGKSSAVLRNVILSWINRIPPQFVNMERIIVRHPISKVAIRDAINKIIIKSEDR